MSDRNPMQVLFYLICSIALCYHITSLTLMYMEYKISTSVSIGFGPLVNLPAVTWCFHLIGTVDWDHQEIRSKCNHILGIDCSNMTTGDLINYSKQLSESKSKSATNKLFDLFDGQDLYRLTIPAAAFISRHARFDIKRIPGRIVWSNLTDSFTTKELIRRYSKCVTLTWRKEYDEVSIVQLYSGTLSPGIFLAIVHSPLLVSRSPLYLFSYSDNNLKINNLASDFISISPDSLTSSSFGLMSSSLLPPPFPTNCFDYNTVGLVVSGQCHDTCHERKVAKLLPGSKVFGSEVLPTDHNIKVLGKGALEHHAAMLEKAYNECADMCSRPNCHQTLYSSKIRSSVVGGSSWLSGHVSYSHNEPAIHTIASPAMSLTEYITVTASCFGFWVGWSILDGMNYVKKLAVAGKRYLHQDAGILQHLKAVNHIRTGGMVTSVARVRNPGSGSYKSAPPSIS